MTAQSGLQSVESVLMPQGYFEGNLQCITDTAIARVPYATASLLASSPYTLTDIPVLEDPVTYILEEEPIAIDGDAIQRHLDERVGLIDRDIGQLSLDTLLREDPEGDHTLGIDLAYAFLSNISQRIANINDVEQQTRVTVLLHERVTTKIARAKQTNHKIRQREVFELRDRLMASEQASLRRERQHALGRTGIQLARVLVSFIEDPDAAIAGAMLEPDLIRLVKEYRSRQTIPEPETTTQPTERPAREERMRVYRNTHAETTDSGEAEDSTTGQAKPIDSDNIGKDTDTTKPSKVSREYPWLPDQTEFEGSLHKGPANDVLVVFAIPDEIAHIAERCRSNAERNQSVNPYDEHISRITNIIGNGVMPWDGRDSSISQLSLSGEAADFADQTIYYRSVKKRGGASIRTYFTVDSRSNDDYVVLTIVGETNKSGRKQKDVLRRLGAKTIHHRRD